MLPPASTNAQQFRSQGVDFCTVGAPGNRAPNTTELADRPDRPPVRPGAVGYTFALSRTEITVSQWQEFVDAYRPYYKGSLADSAFLGTYLQWNPFNNKIEHSPGASRYPTDMSWEYAARYCNWLHNNKSSAAWAFERGAYDTSTFGRPDANGKLPHQLVRSEGARFWIPNLDEWTKGTYYDSDRYGKGVGGYWKYPGRQDTPPIPGFPDQGGQTNAGLPAPPYPDGWPREADAYVNFASAWGLLGTSGGMREWLEPPSYLQNTLVGAAGTPYGLPSASSSEQLPSFTSWGPSSAFAGLRIATIPTPHTAFTFLTALLVTGFSRRRFR